MSKNILKLVVFFVIAMVGGIFADQIIWPYFVERPLFFEYRLDNNPIELTEIRENTVLENTALIKAVKKVDGTVVGIKSETSFRNYFSPGLVLTSDGLIVGLSQSIPKYSTTTYFTEKGSYPLRLLKQDTATGISLLEADGDNLPTVGFADLEKLSLGERVFLVGVDFNSPTSTAKIVNEGVIRKITDDFIETSIIERDNQEGSVLFNILGEVIGLNLVDADNMVFTIPISKIKELAGI